MSNGHESKPWRIGRLLISPKSDIIAVVAFIISAVAFVISAVSLTLQIRAWYLGPEVLLRTPDQIFIFRDESKFDKKVRLHLGASFVYINSASKDYNDIVLKEAVRLPVGNKIFEFGWESFGQFEGNAGDLKLAKARPALPIVLAAGSPQTHQTYFVPWPIDCSADTTGNCDQLGNHVYWDEFIGHLKNLVQAGTNEYVFHFIATLHDESAVEARCKIFLTDKIVGAIELLPSYNPTCYPTP